MKKFNLQFVEKLATTQYRDTCGVLSVDFNDVKNLCDLCIKKGIDMNTFALYAFEIYDESPRGIAIHSSFICKAYLIDKTKYGKTYEEIANNDSLVLRQEEFTATYKEIAQCAKRLSVAIVFPISGEVGNVSLVEE